MVYIQVYEYIQSSFFCTNREYVDTTLSEAANKEAVGIAILVVVLCVSPIIIILVRNAAATIQVMRHS